MRLIRAGRIAARCKHDLEAVDSRGDADLKLRKVSMKMNIDITLVGYLKHGDDTSAAVAGSEELKQNLCLDETRFVLVRKRNLRLHPVK